MRKSIAVLGVALAPAIVAGGVVGAAPQTADGALATYKLTYASLPNGTKQVVRWNGCQKAITYKVNLSSVPSSLRSTVLADTKVAVAKVAANTSFVFSYKG